MKTLITLGALALLALSTAACGRMADLEAPQPRQTVRAPRDDYARCIPDPSTINRPPSQVPIDGGPSNPIGGTAAGRSPQ